ncbi:thiamine pyrophosphate-binding protein [Microbacterium thalassium]|uniref:Thiamine pyrophosphate-dependent acetolactate synthase large subunit-like protein n=1 Tax=Microbacterium thalassium TaxID=362649 RepID=A0A7X0KTC3_9MICO|nr:thiamine pyrophosphate-binding protein [Microbacterium thalassium]MBB6389944.1 thiamine pyrophosphate-dependent acetolactate synthase large subunit-like protein [Microbacterium thalassium]GLK24630.1 acetolactate synthase [Microbacterium thalassium]
MTQTYDGGELLIDALTDLGVDVVFCSSGSEWAPAWEAFARRQEAGEPAPRYIDLTHETVAGGMATGYGLVTRRTQAVLLHATPGLLQGAMAVHGALLAGVPMVVASSESTTYGDGPGQDPGGQWYRNLSIVGGTHPVAQPWTKWSQQVGSVDVLYELVKRTGELAARQPAGPTYLNVPLEILLEETERPVRKDVVARGRRISAPEDVAAVAELLATAERPIVITETAGREEGGYDALIDLCESLGIGVIEPSSAVCANFPKDSALHLGGELDPYVDEADLILLVNCRAPYYPPSRKPAKAKTVVIDEVPQRPHVVYQVLNADHYLEGALPETLAQLREATLALTDQSAIATRSAYFASAHGRWATATADAEARAAASDRIDPVLLATKLREIVRAEGATVVDETITHSRLVQRHVGWDRPDSYFYVQGGLGQGIAVALGVKLAVQDGIVIFTVGDGAFLYNPIVQSLMAAKDLGLPVLIVIFNNKKYLSMKMNHLRFYPQGAAVQTENHLGVDLSTQPELSAFAAPFDMYHAAVDDPAELDRVLGEALAAVTSGTTAVLNVAVSR